MAASGSVGDRPVGDGSIADRLGVTPPDDAAGYWLQTDFVFAEEAADGTYSAVFPITAGMTLLDIVAICGAPFAAPSALLNVRDSSRRYYVDADIGSSNPNSFLVAPYDQNAANPTNFFTLDSVGGGDGFTSAMLSWSNNASAAPGLACPDDDVLTMILVTSGGPVSPAGSLTLRVIYALPALTLDAAFEAA